MNLGGMVVVSVDWMKNDVVNGEDEEEKMLEKILFVCIICKQLYWEFIVMKCGYYFCELCVFKWYRKDFICVVCGVGMMGVFNLVKRLKKLLDRKREREVKW